MFKKMDTSGDDKISIEEFKAAVPIMKRWGVLVTDPEAEFKKIDVNNGGTLLFDEFSHYCITKSLDLEDDDDDEEYGAGEEGLKKDGRDPRVKQKYRYYNAGISKDLA